MTGTITTWVSAFGVGATVGALYFILLWLAVRALTRPSWSFPFRMVAFYLQVLVRIGLVCGGLLLAVMLEAPVGEIALALAGFLVARFVITTVVRRQGQEGT